MVVASPPDAVYQNRETAYRPTTLAIRCATHPNRTGAVDAYSTIPACFLSHDEPPCAFPGNHECVRPPRGPDLAQPSKTTTAAINNENNSAILPVTTPTIAQTPLFRE